MEFKQLLERVMPENDGNVISSKEADELVSKFKKVFNVMGINFALSGHVAHDRLAHPRNKPPISKAEFDFVMTKFVQKYSKQLMDDRDAIQDGNAKARGVNTGAIPRNNFEYVVSSKSTNINIALALKPDDRRGGVVMLPITIMRKRGFGVKQGEAVMVEGIEYSPEQILWVE